MVTKFNDGVAGLGWRVFLLLASAGACLTGGGCATLINSENQMVAFNSDPEGATVAVDGVPMGRTPVVLPVPRKGGDKTITFSKEGHQTVQFNLRNTLDAALAGNLLFGGFIGLGIDAISGRGGGYQKSVRVVLPAGSGMIQVDSKGNAVPPSGDSTLVPPPSPSTGGGAASVPASGAGGFTPARP